MMSPCVVIPVYNESESIATVVEQVSQQGIDVVVVDDGSSDDSAVLAQSKGAIVLRRESRSGKGFALKQGFSYALEQGYDGVVAMDGDGQHDPADLSNFIKESQNNPAAMIVGNRMNDTQDMPLSRKITNQLMSGMISLVCGQHIPDTQCGYRYIPAVLLKELKFESDYYEMESEMLVKAARRKKKIVSIPVRTIYGKGISHIAPFRDTCNFLKYFLKEIFNPSE